MVMVMVMVIVFGALAFFFYEYNPFVVIFFWFLSFPLGGLNKMVLFFFCN